MQVVRVSTTDFGVMHIFKCAKIVPKYGSDKTDDKWFSGNELKLE